ncbi:hypothetical protein BpHYR1_036333 [Brachionus plicatilis]|uniref:Uncharacterized protein n=1 Tax=Brachionus plicatilis TaxID=10195 RepID=A0A3M7QGR3_BRAPC|nr:hypothetical protein BpHYR1_036333 [Brachionus plicatilis]
MPKTIEKCDECGLRTDFCKKGVIKKYRRRITRKVDLKKLALSASNTNFLSISSCDVTLKRKDNFSSMYTTLCFQIYFDITSKFF